MMNEDDIKQAAIERLKAMTNSCNSGMITHNDGVVRGLVWAFTGEDPGANLSGDAGEILDLMEIPYREGSDGMFHFL